MAFTPSVTGSIADLKIIEMLPLPGAFKLDRRLVEVVVSYRRSRIPANIKSPGGGEERRSIA